MTTTALLPLLAAPLLAAPQEPAPGAPSQETIPFMSLSFGDMSQFVVHPKDAGLARACGMLDERAAELPAEFAGEMPPPLAVAFEPGTIPTWMRLLSAPKSVRMDLNPAALANYDMPFEFSMAVHETSPEAATQLEAEVRSMLQRMRAPLPEGMMFLDGSSLVLGDGAVPSPIGETSAAKLLGPGAPVVSEMVMDVGGYLEFIADVMMQQGAPPEMAMIFDIADRMGLMDCVVEAAGTVDEKASRSVSVVTNVGGRMRAAGLVPADGLTPQHLAPIPADATWATVSRFDMAAAFDALNGVIGEILLEQMGAEIDPAQMMAATTGIDLRAGIFGALGDTSGMYASVTTGGGGITSTVFFSSLRDPDALIETKEQLEEMLNGIAASQARGYVSARTWTSGDGEYTTLTFPGIPVPLEPTIAMSDEWFVVAATPQAALGAMQHIESGAPGLAAHPMIAPLAAQGSKTGISYLDTEYYARSGYGVTSMALSGLSNAVRSRVDELRDPGPIMPVYSEFAVGIVPTISYSEITGDDYVEWIVGDPSTVVQTAAVMGFVCEHAAIFLAPAMMAANDDMSRTIRSALR